MHGSFPATSHPSLLSSHIFNHQTPYLANEHPPSNSSPPTPLSDTHILGMTGWWESLTHLVVMTCVLGCQWVGGDLWLVERPETHGRFWRIQLYGV